jgi:UDP-N-acetylglucosamine--N-acetylmuramyl-(pentapeptide) pyrophosphoryl-undecaprenol N-acetylglucosamine transferase
MATRSPLQIVFAGGGSAGRLGPGLAVAAHLKERLPEIGITFVGGGKPIERHPVRAAGFNYVTIPSQPIPRNPFLAMRFVTDNVAGYWASRWYLKEHRTALVVGLGGYASAATVRAANSRGIPTVLLEQNGVRARPRAPADPHR